MRWLDKAARKLRWLAIPYLMFWVSGLMMVVFVATWLFPDVQVSSLLSLNWDRILEGQIWRIVTFVFVPNDSNPFWFLIGIYFYCLIGNGLERQWGSCRFTLFYLTGVLGAILASLFTGYGTNTFLNLSLFLAFASLYPNYPVMVFFVLPVKMKYLAALDVLLLIYSFVIGSWTDRASILFSLLPILLFFGGDLLRYLREQAGYWKTRRNFRKNMR